MAQEYLIQWVGVSTRQKKSHKREHLKPKMNTKRILSFTFKKTFLKKSLHIERKGKNQDKKSTIHIKSKTDNFFEYAKKREKRLPPINNKCRSDTYPFVQHERVHMNKHVELKFSDERLTSSFLQLFSGLAEKILKRN